MALRDFPHLLVDSSRAMSLILFNETNAYDVVSVLGLGRSDGVERRIGHAERTFINRKLGAGLDNTAVKNGQFLNVGAHLYE
jgi:hypothetical protein